MNKDFRDPELAGGLVKAIRRDINDLGRPVRLMEVCGTHTVAISRSGIRNLLDGVVELRSGPGCPVCVTSQEDIDHMISLAYLPNTTVLTYGDMLRVPGATGTLEEARAAGGDVRVLYSALDGVRAAGAEPSRQFVFLAVGFETTAPGTALAVKEAARRGLDNFTLHPAHKTIPAALRALLAPARSQASTGSGGPPAIEGFILPGHVSAVIGRKAYDFLAADFGLPGVITGFEPVDILLAVRELVRSVMARAGGKRVVNLYPRVVREDGNARAQALTREVLEPCPSAWRGLGTIPDSGLTLREEWRAFNAVKRFAGAGGLQSSLHPALGGSRSRAAGISACRCGDVLRGLIAAPECPLFGRGCTPISPVGPCMVSSEGSCAAHYAHERRRYAR